jgi:hypothetical protein
MICGGLVGPLVFEANGVVMSDEGKTNLTKQERNERREKKLPSALQEACVRAREALQRSISGYADGRYDVGRVVRDVSSAPQKYGEEAVKQLGRALGRSDDSLYDYAAVVEAWPDKRSFNALFNRKNANGVALSFSHLVVLAHVKEEARRSVLADEALAEALSVVVLKKRAEQAGRAKKQGEATQATSPLMRSVARLGRVTQSIQAELSSLATTPTTPELLSELQGVIDAQQAAKAELERSLKSLVAEVARRQTEVPASKKKVNAGKGQPEVDSAPAASERDVA